MQYVRIAAEKIVLQTLHLVTLSYKILGYFLFLFWEVSF